jgi:hypothetical protein
MKKSIYLTIKDALTNFGYDNEEVMDALDAEINKGEAVKAENAKMYDSAKEIVMSELNGTPVTIGELWNALADKLTEIGMSKGKLQYAMTRLWKDEIVRTEGKVNTYSKA